MIVPDDGFFLPCDRLEGDISQCNKHLRRNRLDFRLQKGQEKRDLLRRGGTIHRLARFGAFLCWAQLDYVGNINLLSF